MSSPVPSRGGAGLRHAPFAFAERLDHELGDPHEPDGLFTYRRCLELDRREEFPADICARLDELGVPRYYVPERHGGALAGYEDLLMLIRMLSRRDFTVALAHAKTYLGAACTWLGGEPGQAGGLAGKVLAGDVVSLAMTERAHGSDVLAGELAAVPAPAGYRLTGEKWLINNATRAQVVCVLARTDPAGGTRGFSVFLVDKRELADGSYHTLPAVPTHGVRGADISGIGFAGAEVGPAAMIGRPGEGLEIILRSLQVTRTLCAAMSLGMADHALRLAAGFAASHRLYGRRLADLPQAACSLAGSYADLLTAEAVSLVATRSIHCLPGELSVVSAVVKYWVPSTIDAAIARLAEVLGARALLTEDHADGRFQKLARDHRIVGIFDGNTQVNLNGLINQFAGLARGYAGEHADVPGLHTAATLAEPLPELDPAALTLLARRGCGIVQGLPSAVRELLDLPVPAALAEQARELAAITGELHERLAAYRPSARAVPARGFALARRYADCFAAAACVHLWLRNRSAVDGELWADGTWLQACLARLLDRLRPGGGEAKAAGELLGPLWSQYREGRLFSLLPCELRGEAVAG